MVAVWLAILALAGWTAWRLSQPDRSMVGGALLAPSSAALVAAVDIHSRVDKGEGVRLRRVGSGAWQVRLKNGWKPARAELVGRLVRDLTGMRIARVVARGKTHDAELGLDRGVDVVLRDASGKTMLAVTVGGQGGDLLSTYLRVHGRPGVVAVDRALVWQVRRPLMDWVKEAPREEKKASASAGARKRP